MALSEAWLKANHKKEREKTEERADRDALSVRVSPKGKIVFQLRYNYAGKAKRLDLGSYPLMSLKDARAEGQRLRAQLEQGHDPKNIRRKEKTNIINAKSFNDLFYMWYENSCKPKKAAHHQILRSFEIHALPVIGEFLADEISLQQWVLLLEDLTKHSQSIAARILLNSDHVYRWAIKRELASVNHLKDISAKHDLNIIKNSTERALTNQEIYLSWHALDKTRMAVKNKIFMKLCLMYGCRVGELKLAKKKDFDFEKGVWTIPAENHKTGKLTKKPLLRPIIPEFESLIRQAMMISYNSDYIFTALNSTEPMKESGHLSMPNNIFQWLKRHKNYEMLHWSLHDLRRTMRTNMSELAPPHVCEIMLGHALPKMWQTYDRYDYLKEQAEAYKAWYERLQVILNNHSLDVAT